MIRERVIVHADLLVSGLDIGGLKWRFANDERVNDDTHRPSVHFVAMAGLAFEDFRRDIVGRAANGLLLLALELELGGETEIAQLDFQTFIKK